MKDKEQLLYSIISIVAVAAFIGVGVYGYVSFKDKQNDDSSLRFDEPVNSYKDEYFYLNNPVGLFRGNGLEVFTAGAVVITDNGNNETDILLDMTNSSMSGMNYSVDKVTIDNKPAEDVLGRDAKFDLLVDNDGCYIPSYSTSKVKLRCNGADLLETNGILGFNIKIIGEDGSVSTVDGLKIDLNMYTGK